MCRDLPNTSTCMESKITLPYKLICLVDLCTHIQVFLDICRYIYGDLPNMSTCMENHTAIQFNMFGRPLYIYLGKKITLRYKSISSVDLCAYICQYSSINELRNLSRKRPSDINLKWRGDSKREARGGGLGSRPIFKKVNEPYAPS